MLQDRESSGIPGTVFNPSLFTQYLCLISDWLLSFHICNEGHISHLQAEVRRERERERERGGSGGGGSICLFEEVE